MEMSFIASSLKGKTPVKGSSLRFKARTSHHIPAPQEIIEISDSDEPDSSRFTGMNQDPSIPSTSFLETGQDIIEILSSEAEENLKSPHSPSPLTQTLPLPPQLPEVSSSCEIEKMMDIDDTTQHSPPIPFPPSLLLQMAQADPVDAIERTLSNVSVSSSPIHQSHPPHVFGSVDDSEPEGGPLTEENNCDSHPPPPSSSGSPSNPIPPSRQPTPTVRCLIYSGPNGIFRDANASIMQHAQVILPQNPASPLESYSDEGAKAQLPSTSGTVGPQIPNPPYGPATSQVKNNSPTFKCT